jgi:hypothetical protein
MMRNTVKKLLQYFLHVLQNVQLRTGLNSSLNALQISLLTEQNKLLIQQKEI